MHKCSLPFSARPRWLWKCVRPFGCTLPLTASTISLAFYWTLSSPVLLRQCCEASHCDFCFVTDLQESVSEVIHKITNRTQLCNPPPQKPPKTLLYPLIVICLYMESCLCVCTQNPREQGAMAWNWREPTGRVSSWWSPPSPPSFPSGSRVMVRRAAGGIELFECVCVCVWGGHAPLSATNCNREITWDSLGGWAEGRMEKAAVHCFSLTSSPARVFLDPLCGLRSGCH